MKSILNTSPHCLLWGFGLCLLSQILEVIWMIQNKLLKQQNAHIWQIDQTLKQVAQTGCGNSIFEEFQSPEQPSVT